MNKPPSILVIFIGLLILGLGLLLSVFQGILHAPEYISAYLTKVDHPIKAHYDYTDKFLKEVVKDGKVDYAAARNNKNLDKALKEFAELSCDEFENDGERLIYWSNAYNLMVIKTVADHFPIAQIKNVNNDLSSHRYTLGGQPLTAKDISLLKIQPLLRGTQNGDTTDARMLFLTCAGAMGYPPVLDHAITRDTVRHDIEENTFKFFHKKTNVFYNEAAHTLYLSPFFQWNSQLLSTSFVDPWAFVVYYLGTDEKPDTQSLSYKQNYLTTFDWRINDTETKD